MISDARLDELADAPEAPREQFHETVTVEARCIPGRTYINVANTRREALANILREVTTELQHWEDAVLGSTEARDNVAKFRALVEDKLGKEPGRDDP